MDTERVLSRHGDENLNDEEKSVVFKKIQKLHLVAALFMGVQTIAYGAVGANARVKPTVGFPTDCEDGPVCSPDMKILGETNVIWLITFFVALASFDHFITWCFSKLREREAKYWLFIRQSNPFRWIEYSISASIMAVAVSILTGIHDVHLWFLIFCMHAVGMFIGQLIELLPRDDSPGAMSSHSLRVGAYILGSASIFLPWLIIFCYFFKAATRDGSDIPNFVYAAFLGTFVLFTTFGANSFACHILRKYDFATAEMIYIVLSFTSKTFLAADVFGGLNASDE